MSRRVFLGLGSNLGDRAAYLRRAVDVLKGHGLKAISPVYETEPVGGPEEQGPYLNMVVELLSGKSPRELLHVCQELEKQAGRVREVRWGPRTLDVDLLWIEDTTVDEPDLTVPHPRMWERRFVLAPLQDLAPELVEKAVLDQSVGHVERLGSLDDTDSDEELYRKTLGQYNDPAFAKQYAANIEERLDEWMFDEFLPLVPAEASVLDIACAAGRDAGYMMAKGFKVTGIDYSKELLKLARQKYPAIAFVQGDFTKLPFEDESFEAIWCKAALVHLPSQKEVKKALTEFWRVLKPGGAIMINTKAKLSGEVDTAVRTDKLSGRERYFRFQEEGAFHELLRSCGFEILQSKVYNEQKAVAYVVLRNENWMMLIAKKAET
jgi:2-amino-4-hydroxy-6-hydroxymethyldihydropteridine diphosphokinase